MIRSHLTHVTRNVLWTLAAGFLVAACNDGGPTTQPAAPASATTAFSRGLPSGALPTLSSAYGPGTDTTKLNAVLQSLTPEARSAVQRFYRRDGAPRGFQIVGDPQLARALQGVQSAHASRHQGR